MPSITGKNVYKYDQIYNNFTEFEIKEEQKVDDEQYIFDNRILDSFKNNPVLFVYSKGSLKGVIHFCDYNRNVVYVYVYSVLLEFERLLRLFLIKNNIEENDIFIELQIKNESKIKKRRSEEREDINIDPFQIFDLGHITDYIKTKFKIDFNPDRDITNLRNYIMHGKSLISKEDYLKENFIYNYNSFKIFFNRVEKLNTEFNKIYNLLVFEKYNIWRCNGI